MTTYVDKFRFWVGRKMYRLGCWLCARAAEQFWILDKKEFPDMDCSFEEYVRDTFDDIEENIAQS